MAGIPGEEMEARRYGAAFLPEFKFGPGRFEFFPVLGRPDEEGGHGGIRREARHVPGEDRRMRDDLFGSGLRQNPGQAARMIEMAVAYQDGGDVF